MTASTREARRRLRSERRGFVEATSGMGKGEAVVLGMLGEVAKDERRTKQEGRSSEGAADLRASSKGAFLRADARGWVECSVIHMRGHSNVRSFIMNRLRCPKATEGFLTLELGGRHWGSRGKGEGLRREGRLWWLG